MEKMEGKDKLKKVPYFVNVKLKSHSIMSRVTMQVDQKRRITENGRNQ